MRNVPILLKAGASWIGRRQNPDDWPLCLLHVNYKLCAAYSIVIITLIAYSVTITNG